MLTVFIAEDEKVERDALKLILNRYYHEKICILGEATTGVDTVAMIKSHPADLVLMDIQMPQLDGLKAAELIKQYAPQVEIIIITAFGLFEYAKQAIKIGVVDYIVKPYSIKSLQLTIDRAVTKVNLRKEAQRQTQDLHDEVRQMKKLIEWELMLNLTKVNHLSRIRLNYYFNLLETPQKAFCFCVVLENLKIPYDSDYFDRVKKSFLKVSQSILSGALMNEWVFYVFNSSRPPQPGKMVRQQQTEWPCLGEDLLMGISEVVNDYDQLHLLYIQAKSQIVKAAAVQVPSLYYPYEMEVSLWRRILQCDKIQAENVLDDIFIKLSAVELSSVSGLKEYYFQLMIYLYHTAVHLHPNLGNYFSLAGLRLEFEELAQFEAIRRYLANFVGRIIDAIGKCRGSNYSKLIGVAKSYIYLHYQTATLEEVAHHIGLSKYYLSKCFKQVTGENFIDFLTEVRMEKAKELLLQKEMTVAEICYAVGFADPNYFSRAFKKYTGISPKGFQ
jgi:two-component system response regulator YesN